MPNQLNNFKKIWNLASAFKKWNKIPPHLGICTYVITVNNTSAKNYRVLLVPLFRYGGTGNFPKISEFFRKKILGPSGWCIFKLYLKVRFLRTYLVWNIASSKNCKNCPGPVDLIYFNGALFFTIFFYEPIFPSIFLNTITFAFNQF